MELKKWCAIWGRTTPIVLDFLAAKFLAIKFGEYPNSMAVFFMSSVVLREMSGCPRSALETVMI